MFFDSRQLAFVLLGLAPAAFAGDFRPDAAAAARAPQQNVPPASVAQAMSRRPPVDRPFQFAAGVEGGWSLADGAWTTEGDTAVWRLRVRSENARSLSLRFSPLRLPPGAAVWIYDTSGTLVHGPLEQDDAHPAGVWTPIVPADELVIEARAPAGLAEQMQLGIATVYHGFRGWKEADAAAKSGSCNIDVACAQANGWRDAIRSVARITIANQYLCSGQLLNNTREDQTPYFLTADHCGIGDEPEDRGPAASVVFYWNYETSACNGPADGNLGQTQAGSQFVADDVTSDFTLLRLNAAPPAEYNVHYAGWNSTTQTPQSGAGIHHPAGDEKRISLYDVPAQPVQGQFPGSNHPVLGWQVRWSQGVTEQGSSGSGLWDQNRRVVGVLSYGNTSCENQNGTDVYGRLDAAWTASPAPEGQLKAHLDPDNTGATFLDGRGGVAGPDVDGPASGPAPQSYDVGAMPWLTLLLCLGLAALRQRPTRR